MSERAEPILKIACLILAMAVLYQFAGIFLRINPLHGVIVPALPVLTANTNISNSVVPSTLATAATATNIFPHPQTNSVSMKTNAQTGTNILVAGMSAETNISRQPNPGMPVANFMPPPGMVGANFNPFAPPEKRADDLPPAVQARIGRIVDSEIFGPVMHPLPMALLGIAGDDAFLRTASGQTGLVKAGDSLGELKLLKIGINRVLVEQNGQKSELMIFSGYGGDSLLPKLNDETNKP
jgi:hypothetical protein